MRRTNQVARHGPEMKAWRLLSAELAERPGDYFLLPIERDTPALASGNIRGPDFGVHKN